jgi:TRAP-type C4-dicarboxylate transport system substrate-binding protein
VDPVIIYWNKKQWNQFPPDIQKAIKDSAEEAGIFEKALCRAGLDGNKSLDVLKNKFNHTMEVPEPIKFMESKGMTVTFLTDDQRNAFIEATKPLYEKWVPKIGQALYKQAMADMAN